MRKSIFVWESAGIFFIIIFGSFLHFAFELSGNWKPLALIAAVNESVWEHLKLAFWPGLFYSLFELGRIRKSTNNFIAAKTASLYTMPIAIVVLFYSYTWILGEDLFIMDILIFIIAVIIGQLVSYKLLTSRKLPQIFDKLALLLLIIVILSFSLLTFYAPHFTIFRDPISGGYGIID